MQSINYKITKPKCFRNGTVIFKKSIWLPTFSIHLIKKFIFVHSSFAFNPLSHFKSTFPPVVLFSCWKLLQLKKQNRLCLKRYLKGRNEKNFSESTNTISWRQNLCHFVSGNKFATQTIRFKAVWPNSRYFSTFHLWKHFNFVQLLKTLQK